MKRVLTLSLFAALAAGTAAANQLYKLTIDTTSLPSGTTGFIDLSFNGGFPAVASIGSFAITGGSLNAGSLATQGTITGTLPGLVTLLDDNADYFEGINFGSAVSFNLSLNGSPSGSTGDVFTLSFFNSAQTDALLTGNLNDLWLAQFQMDTAGKITPTAYANPSGGPSFATITVIPEPAAGWMLIAAAGLTLLWFKRLAPRR
jgi:hypothetical protein